MNIQQRIVSEPEVEKALDFLRDEAKTIGDAKARLVRAEHFVKHVEALMFVASDASSAEKKKAEARTSQRYLDAIEEEALAAGEYEKLRALREAASMKIDAWRTEQSNFRAMKI